MTNIPYTLPRLMTPNEVADILKVTPATIRNMIRRGDLPAVQLPGRRGIYRIPAHALSALMGESPIEARGNDGLTNINS